MSSKYLLLFFTVFLFSCRNPQQSPAQQLVAVNEPVRVTHENFKKGEVIPHVSVEADTSQSYALFLPSGYSDSVAFPTIIFFDPHGEGSLPLKLYQNLANEFGFVLIGNNNSKNGLQWEQISTIANNLIAETEHRFSVDENKIALCGFSGGAKAALMTAINNMAVSSVIYCGAAVPIQQTTHPLSLLGFAGKRDMNYSDVVLFDRNLGSSSKHLLIEWDGKHEWVSNEIFRDAFLFLRNGSVENYSKKQVSISDEQLAAEQNFKQIYLNAFQSKDVNWWKKEIVMLNGKKKTDAMYERLLGFISLACYSYASQSLQQNNLPVAEKILAIYQLSDPGNRDCALFLSQLNSRKTSK